MKRKRDSPIPDNSKNEHKQHTHTHHPVLSLYYPRLLSLRDYILQSLPASSKARRRRVASLGLNNDNNQCPDDVSSLAHLLDTTLVGILRESTPTVNTSRQREFAAFTQSQARSSLISTDIGATTCQGEIVDFSIYTLFNKHSPHKNNTSHLLCHGYQRCTDSVLPNQEHGTISGIPGLVPVYPNKNVSALKNYPWTGVLALLGKNCEEVMMHLLLDCGLFTLVDRDRDTFYQISGVQLSELKLLSADLNSSSAPNVKTGKDLHTSSTITFVRRRILYSRPSLNAKGQVRLGLRHIHVLNRYPDPSNPSHTIHIMKYIFPRQFGLHNVFTSKADPRETVQGFKDYTLREEEIATRERSNRNGSKIPKRLRGEPVELVRKLQKRHKACSYTELLRYYCPIENNRPRSDTSGTASSAAPTSPSTFQSTASEQFTTQQKQSPGPAPESSSVNPSSLPTTPSDDNQPTPHPPTHAISLTDHATPPSAVSAFSRAVLRKLIPSEFFGRGSDGRRNREQIMRHVDQYVKMRKFESLSLHEVVQGVNITCITWLQPPSAKVSPESNLSASDISKRRQILHEFIYYIFDSLLTPLLSSTFYITESSTHRNRLFYFRHDVWRALTTPSLSHLKLSMFEEVKRDKAERILAGRRLGYSSLRLLPKKSGVRMIANLRRRCVVTKTNNKWGGAGYLGPSINSVMTPVFNVLSYEKTKAKKKMKHEEGNNLGSAMFAVGDMYPRLKAFKSNLEKQGKLPGDSDSDKSLFFVKLDIQSCFDTIPQDELLRLVERLVSEDEYRIAKHVEIRPPEFSFSSSGGKKNKPVKKYISQASAFTDFASLYDQVNNNSPSPNNPSDKNNKAQAKKNTVFIPTSHQKRYETTQLLDLVDSHIRSNILKIGRKYFRQLHGIPQGSILSTLLCNFFYAQHERECLNFVTHRDNDDTLLLRLVDDYLLISTERDVAMEFLQVMLAGNPKYGISVNVSKTLVNFSASVNGHMIPRLLNDDDHPRSPTTQFPYCGTLIDTRTLSLRKDSNRTLKEGGGILVSDTLTVEGSKAPGAAFVRKAETFFEVHAHDMFLDTGHNSVEGVWGGLYKNFRQAGEKMMVYLRSLGRRRKGAGGVCSVDALLRRGIGAVIELAQSKILRSKRSSSKNYGFDCAVTKTQVRWLAAAAFGEVVGKKQTRFRETARWLDMLRRENRAGRDGEMVRMWKVVRREETDACV